MITRQPATCCQGWARNRGNINTLHLTDLHKYEEKVKCSISIKESSNSFTIVYFMPLDVESTLEIVQEGTKVKQMHIAGHKLYNISQKLSLLDIKCIK